MFRKEVRAVRLFIFDVDQKSDRTEKRAETLGVPECFGDIETDRLKKKKNKKAYRSSLGALVALRMLLPEGEGLTIGRDPHDKPYFIGEKTEFNLSHSAELAVAAVSGDKVGVDIELIKSRENADGIAERYFMKAEKERYKSSSGSAEVFFRIWTAKEAISKCIGSGFASTYKETDSEHEDVKECFKLYRYEIFFEGERYIMTVCSESCQSIEITTERKEIEVKEIK